MNANFEVKGDTRSIVPKPDGATYPIAIVTYKGFKLAIFSGDDRISRADEYIRTYGYLAEWRRLGSPSWDESMRVNINGR